MGFIIFDLILAYIALSGYILLFMPSRSMFGMKNKRKICRSLMLLSVILAGISLIIGKLYYYYNEINVVILFMNGIATLCLFWSSLKSENEYVQISASEYELFKDANSGPKNYVQRGAIWGENTIVFEGGCPIEPVDIIAELTKTEEGLYICMNYIQLNRELTWKEKIEKVHTAILLASVLFIPIGVAMVDVGYYVGEDIAYFLSSLIGLIIFGAVRKLFIGKTKGLYGKFLKLVFNSFYYITLVLIVLYLLLV